MSSSVVKKVLNLCLFLALGHGIPATAIAQSGPVVWVAPSLQRIGPSDPAGSGGVAQIFAAKGEYESFQIVVRAPSAGLTNVDVTISDLQGLNGAVIPKSSLTLYREHYVYVNSSSPDWGGPNRPLGAGWFADGLIPFNDPGTGLPLTGAALDAVPFHVTANRNQPIWVDVLVPRSAKAGQYTATFTVRSDQGTVHGTVALTVWNFSLPMTPTLQSSFLLWQADSLQAQQELLRHKLSPLKSNALDQRGLISSLGLGAAGLPFWSGADLSNCTMAPAPPVSSFLAAATAQQPGLLLYDYSADEIGHCTNLYSNIKQWARNMHLAGVNNLITMAPTPGLYDDGSGTGRSAVDIWVLLPIMYNQSRTQVAQVLGKGDAVWSYNTLVQDPYSPKWLIDFSPINFRIQPGFISQTLGLTGLLYWRVDRWSSDPWSNVNNAGIFSSANFPGEGMLLYPGQKVGVSGVTPSMRLKWLRDGVEDFEYIATLKKLGRGEWAQQLARSVGADWTNWTRDAQALESVRRQLGAEIQRLVGAPPPTTSANAAPAAVSVNPSSGSGFNRTFTLTYTDANGASDLTGAGTLVNNTVKGSGACWFYYEAASNRIWLANDNATNWSWATPGSSATLQNSQCNLNASGTNVSMSGKTLTLAVSLGFKQVFAGTRTLHLYANDKAGAATGYRALGAWTVPAR